MPLIALVALLLVGGVAGWPRGAAATPAIPAPAAAPAAPAPHGRPLAEVLNSDGTLNTAAGYQGSLDPRGWRLAPCTSCAPAHTLLG